MIFSSLLHGSVLSVLCFTMAVGELLQATLEGAILRTAASGRRKFLCSLGIMGLGDSSTDVAARQIHVDALRGEDFSANKTPCPLVLMQVLCCCVRSPS